MIGQSKWVVGAVLLAMVSTVAVGADADTLKVINELKARIARLEDQQSMEQQREEIMKVVREMHMDAGEQGALPGWMEGLTFFGDFRLRYQHDKWTNAADNTANRKNRGRARFRLRFGFTKDWLEKQLTVYVRLASGEPDQCEDDYGNSFATGYGNATSTNQTFTNAFSKKPIWIDWAYATYKPAWLKGLVVGAGKMANPLVRTDLTWDSDVTPEGAYASYSIAFGPITPFGTVAYLVVDEAHAVNDYDDTYVWVYQTGFDWKIIEDVAWKFAATVYDFDNAGQGGLETTGDTGSGSNTGELGRLTAINLTNKVKFKVVGLPVSVFFDWVWNCDNDAQSTEYEEQQCAYAAGFKVGQNKKKGDWSGSYEFKYIQPNAWSGALNDADFGGTDRKGHVLRGKYNITDFLTVRASLFYTEPVTNGNPTTDPEDSRNIKGQWDLMFTW